MSRLANILLFSVSCLSGFSIAGAAQSIPACEPTPDHPVVVCFAEKPLTVDHCARPASLVPHFVVKRLPAPDAPPSPYFYTYQLIVNNIQMDPADPFQSKFILTEDDPSQYGTITEIPFHGTNTYSLHVTVHTMSNQSVTSASQSIYVEDKPVVRALVIGVSHYDNSSNGSLNDLLHADADATSFATVINNLLYADLHVDLRTSALTPNVITPADIFGELTQEEEQDLCGDNDWFIFYFSGHGIVGASQQNSRKQTFGHYISTKAFDPKRLQRTSIGIGDLMQKLSDVHATNELVILDSCFSGAFGQTSTAAPVTANVDSRSPAGHVRSSKVEYVIGGELVDPVRIAPADIGGGGGDVLVFQQTADKLEYNRSGRRALYLSAAGSDQEAREGIASYGADGLAFVASETETKEQKDLGHGLYTFSFLWRLLKQLPTGTVIPDNWLGSAPAAIAPAGECKLDLSTAHDQAKSDIKEMGLRTRKDVQVPDVSGKTHDPVPLLPCKITPPLGDNNATVH